MIMSQRLTSSVWTRILLVSIWMTGASALFAAEPPATPPQPSKEQRGRMAAVHEKMAACLRSDKEFSVCRDEMLKSWEMSGDHGCPMMDMGMDSGRKGPATKPDGE
jgi:hypothetical protein